jgi:GNAT superfamily N-acetyltransferase
MRITVGPFTRQHLDAAGRLLAARHARYRAASSLLPAEYEAPGAWRPMLESAVAATGVHAARCEVDGDIAGFMAMEPMLFGPAEMVAAFFAPRSAQVGFGSHAAREDVAFDVYRELYAEVSQHLVALGFFDHVVYVAPDDVVVNDAFVSLGFGRSVTAAIRGVEPIDAEPVDGAIEIHQVSSEAIRDVIRLNDELSEHHRATPIYWPHLPETAAATEEFQRQLLDDPANAHFVAYERGRAIGMQTFMPPDWVAPPLRPEQTVYLYQGIVSADARSHGIGRAILAAGIDWCREQGYRHVALHFASANISGARFWQAAGFRPTEYRLTRHVDSRVGWNSHATGSSV